MRWAGCWSVRFVVSFVIILCIYLIGRRVSNKLCIRAHFELVCWLMVYGRDCDILVQVKDYLARNMYVMRSQFGNQNSILTYRIVHMHAVVFMIFH